MPRTIGELRKLVEILEDYPDDAMIDFLFNRVTIHIGGRIIHIDMNPPQTP
jgi:hypothetical protein